jgi:hypothetical protein
MDGTDVGMMGPVGVLNLVSFLAKINDVFFEC